MPFKIKTGEFVHDSCTINAETNNPRHTNCRQGDKIEYAFSLQITRDGFAFLSTSSYEIINGTLRASINSPTSIENQCCDMRVVSTSVRRALFAKYKWHVRKRRYSFSSYFSSIFPPKTETTFQISRLWPLRASAFFIHSPFVPRKLAKYSSTRTFIVRSRNSYLILTYKFCKIILYLHAKPIKYFCVYTRYLPYITRIANTRARHTCGIRNCIYRYNTVYQFNVLNFIRDYVFHFWNFRLLDDNDGLIYTNHFSSR